MTRGVRVVCRPSLRDGFALAGVQALPALDAREAALILDDLLGRSEVGVVLVEESLFETLSETRRRALEQRTLPLVVPFPGPRPEETPTAELYLVQLLRRAIGYRVHLR
jgi:vacuolar-type H+-ATPase subunit F/Vma7